MPIDYRYGIGYVKYKITLQERWQIIKAFFKSLFLGGCIADYISMELEELLCGFDGNKHTIIRPPDV